MNNSATKVCNALGVCISSNEERILTRIAELRAAETTMKKAVELTGIEGAPELILARICGLVAAHEEFEANQRRISELEQTARTRGDILDDIRAALGIAGTGATIEGTVHAVRARIGAKRGQHIVEAATAIGWRVEEEKERADKAEKANADATHNRDAACDSLKLANERADKLRRELLEARQQILDDDTIKTKTRNALTAAGIPETEPLEHVLFDAIRGERSLSLDERARMLGEWFFDANRAVNRLFAMNRAFDLRTLQVRLPWSIKYSRDFRANQQSHKDFTHAILHVVKATGQLAAFIDDMDHDRDAALFAGARLVYAKNLADLVICALRAANVFPGGPIDLERAVVERIETKNAVKL